MAGPPGAAAGGFLASMLKKPVQGQLRLDLTYTPLELVDDAPVASADTAQEATRDPNAEETRDPTPRPLRTAPRGGIDGVDWSELYDGIDDTPGADDLELCCFLTHQGTSTEAAIWRDVARRLVVIAFRGTSDVRDAVTDVSIAQTPLEAGFEGQESDDPRQVHSGFFASARAVDRRLKELLVAACAGTPGDWDLLITGHSLGGAIATLIGTELVDQ